MIQLHNMTKEHHHWTLEDYKFPGLSSEHSTKNNILYKFFLYILFPDIFIYMYFALHQVKFRISNNPSNQLLDFEYNIYLSNMGEGINVEIFFL